MKPGPKPKDPKLKRVMVRLSIYQFILDEIGGIENKYELLKPSVNKKNNK